jgi:DNA processing protein
MREKILYYAIHYNGNWHKIANAMHNQEPWKKLTYQGDYITYEDEMYPKQLKQLEQPPWILFYQGNIQLLEKKAVAIIGSRICDAYGQTRTSHIVSLLKEQAVIISGMAKGIDAIAHKTALSKQTIGVIGCGLDIIYPKENEYLYQTFNHQRISKWNGTIIFPFSYAQSDHSVFIASNHRHTSKEIQWDDVDSQRGPQTRYTNLLCAPQNGRNLW